MLIGNIILSVLTVLMTLTAFRPVAAQDSWIAMSPMRAASCHLTATAGIDGKIHAVGSSDEGFNILSTVKTYKAQTDTPVCDIQMSHASYINGETVTSQILRIANPTATPIAIELKLWFDVPANPPVLFINIGANGDVVLPAGFEQDFGPLPLAAVTKAFPLGTYGFNCRILHPVTGMLLAEDLNQFAIYTDEKPSELPSFSSLSLYSASSPFNQGIGQNPQIAPNSKMLIGSLSDAGDFVIQVKQYSAPVYFVNNNTPRHDVKLECGSTWETGVTVMRGVPIPDWAEPAFDADGADNPPAGCGENSDQDNNMVILDLSTRCEYDFWQARKTNDQWVASWGNSIRIDGNGVYSKGLSTRGSGFAFLGGAIWPDELQAGKIEHVLAFSYPFTRSCGPVPPATDSDGESDRLDAIPEGALLQLNPDIDLGLLNLAPYENTIAKALQKYGMILVDNAGTGGIGLYAIDPKSVTGSPYHGVLPDKDYIALLNIPFRNFVF